MSNLGRTINSHDELGIDSGSEKEVDEGTTENLARIFAKSKDLTNQRLSKLYSISKSKNIPYQIKAPIAYPQSIQALRG